MPHHSRIPIPVNTLPLHRMRSESCLEDTQAPRLPRLRSLGQLSPPPDMPPPPPLPLRSPLRISGHENNIAPGHGHSSNNDLPVVRSDNGSIPSSYHSEDDTTEPEGLSSRNTMLLHYDQGRRNNELKLYRSSRQTPNLGDLSYILQYRGRLQEMGSTFSPEGELLTYGNPSLNTDLQQMLRLGSLYEQLWNLFFDDGNENSPDKALWPDLRVLKKMLQNEGVQFGSYHKRLNYGNLYPKIIRLSDQYDVLHAEWLAKTLHSIHPALRLDFPVERPPSPPIMHRGWGFVRDDEPEDQTVRSRSRRSTELAIIDEEQPSRHHVSGTTTLEWVMKDHWPLPQPESLANARDPSPVADMDPVSSRRSSGSSLLEHLTPIPRPEPGSMLLVDATYSTRPVSIQEYGQHTQCRSHELEGELDVRAADARTRAANQEHTSILQDEEFPLRNEDTRKSSKKVSLWSSLKARFSLKRNRSL